MIELWIQLIKFSSFSSKFSSFSLLFCFAFVSVACWFTDYITVCWLNDAFSSFFSPLLSVGFSPIFNSSQVSYGKYSKQCFNKKNNVMRRTATTTKKDFRIELKGVANSFSIQQEKTDVKIYSTTMTGKK